VPKPGNREAIEEEKTILPQDTVIQKENIEKTPFKKPIPFMQEHMKVTSIRETLEKNKVASNMDANKQAKSEQQQTQRVTEPEPITAPEITETTQQQTTQIQSEPEQVYKSEIIEPLEPEIQSESELEDDFVTSEPEQVYNSEIIDPLEPEIQSESELEDDVVTSEPEQVDNSEIIDPLEPEIQSESELEDDFVTFEPEQNLIFTSLQDCWEDAVNESSTDITKDILLKQILSETENQLIEIEVPNELAKQEIREILPALTQCITKKTGIPYSITLKVVKTAQERQIDRTNPDEKFKYLCEENPKLQEFKERLNLSVS
jgi:hypothetical protein